MSNSSTAPSRTFPHLWKYNDYQAEGTIARIVLRDRDGNHTGLATIDYGDLNMVLRAAHWTLHRTEVTGLSYAGGIARGVDTPVGRRKPRLFLHRLLMAAPEGLQVDHRNGDGLDCRRENMVIATNQGNALNRGTHRRARHLEHAIRQLLACEHHDPDCACRVYARELLPG